MTDSDRAPGPMSTESADPATEDLDLLPAEEQVRRILAGDAQVVPAVQQVSDAVAEAVREVVERLRAGGRLVYVGAGTAGRTAALDAAEIGPTFGVASDLVSAVVAGGLGTLADAREGLEDDEAAGADDLRAHGIGPLDVVVAVSASGSTPYTVAAAEAASSIGARTIAVVGNQRSPLARTCDLAVVVDVGPEAVAGSTRLRAGTAQKVVLNLLSTLAMVGLGHTYGNRMIGVRPDNDKLRARALAALTDIAGASQAEARAALAATGDARTALVVLLAGADGDAAAAALRECDGRVREAVALFGPRPVEGGRR